MSDTTQNPPEFGGRPNRQELRDMIDPAPPPEGMTRQQLAAMIESALPGNEVVRVKALRREIDLIIQSTRELPPSRERALAITKLQEGVMWLGMDLKRIGEENPSLVAAANPYPRSKDPSSTVIDPTADGLKL